MDNLIVTLEDLPKYLDEGLDGTHGSNRHPDSGRTAAKNDYEAVMLWLRRFDSSPYTQANYRKEIERFYLWAINHGMALSDLKHENLEDYKNFLQDPQPTSEWCGPAVGRGSDNWKPFTGGLSPASRNQSLTILSACFGFFTQMGYLKYNPLKLLFKGDLRKQINKSSKVERYLEKDVWNYLWDFIKAEQPSSEQPSAAQPSAEQPSTEQPSTEQPSAEQPLKADKDDKAVAAHQRRVFLFSLLYLLAPRVSEVANHTMGSFREERGKWWWEVEGKGSKLAKIPVPKPMLDALQTYRTQLGLSPLPQPGDNHPLIGGLDDHTKPLTPKMIYLIVKETFAQAAEKLQLSSPHKAERLRQASTHWMRHTSITHQADKGIDIRHLQATARHASITTTQRYMHHEEERWHADIEKHSLD